MKKQLQYYEHVVPVSPQRHRDWSMEVRSDYEFAGHSNSVPLTAAEIPTAALEYAVVFTGSEEPVQPAVILGLKPDENLYLDEQNHRFPSVASRHRRKFLDGLHCADPPYNSLETNWWARRSLPNGHI